MFAFKTNKRIGTFISYFLIGLSGLMLDRISKVWAADVLKAKKSIPIIQGVFNLTYAENDGAAFSMLEGQFTVFYIITAVIMIAIIWLLSSGKVHSAVAEYSLLFIAVGGMGNFIDRFTAHYVVDMFDFCYINFAIFNVADIYVTCGSLLFILVFILSKGDIIKW